MPQTQADALRAFVAERHRSRLEQAGSEDERFRFMTGFNDFFFAIGIVLLGFGAMYFTDGMPLPSLVAAILVWALSELLVRRMRLVLPGILLSLFFVVFAYLAVPIDLATFSSPALIREQLPLAMRGIFGLTGTPDMIALKALIGAAAAALYYWRFRLPFTLLPIAGAIVLAVMNAAFIVFGTTTITHQVVVMLACGLTVFAIAMSFDLSDRDRLTRRSDCAFWLHLLAAPLIVHSLISLVTPRFGAIDNTVAGLILLIVAVLAIIAIVIDRRALLVSTLIYVGGVIAYAANTWIGQSNPAQGSIFFMTLVILGIFVITLGVGWQPLRRALLAIISPSIASKLPPVPKSA